MKCKMEQINRKKKKVYTQFEQGVFSFNFLPFCIFRLESKPVEGNPATFSQKRTTALAPRGKGDKRRFFYFFLMDLN